jgi:heterotetrameric sarcosine oxidase gamma subunit
MPEILSPLAHIQKAGSFGAHSNSGPGVNLSDSCTETLVQIAGWGDFEDAVLPGLREVGFNDAGDYRSCRHIDGWHLFRIAPDRVLIAGQSELELPGSITGNDALAVLDLSHSRTRIIVDGTAAEEVMARLAPIDFRASSMPVDSFVQTGIHHVSVLIHRTDEMQFEIFTPVTWVRSVWELICLNAAPFGYIVEGKA